HGNQYLWRCFQHVSHVFNDNSAYREHLIDVFAMDEDKLTVIYHPVPRASEPRQLPKSYRDGTFHVMWAGRFDRDKRPDVLYEIASRLMNEDFVFHVYGAPLLDNFGAAYQASLSKLPNVKLYGQFRTFFDLPT